MLIMHWDIVSGLAGKDVWQTALTDQYIELMEDMFRELAKSFFEKDDIKKVSVWNWNKHWIAFIVA